MIYEGIRRGGHPGIEAAGDTGDYWLFSVAPIELGIVEYGLPTYFVHKETGSIRVFSPVDEADWELIDKAVEVPVPEEYRPQYYKHPFKILDVVKLRYDDQKHGVKRSFLGTIVDIISSSNEVVFTVEFLDDHGETVESALLTEYKAYDLILVQRHT